MQRLHSLTCRGSLADRALRAGRQPGTAAWSCRWLPQQTPASAHTAAAARSARGAATLQDTAYQLTIKATDSEQLPAGLYGSRQVASSPSAPYTVCLPPDCAHKDMHMPLSAQSGACCLGVPAPDLE